MLESIGWIGATLFAFCAVPQCLKVHSTKSTKDISWLFLMMWFWGEVLTLSYVFITNYLVGIYQIPLLANYIFNFLLLLYLIYGKIKYSDAKQEETYE